MKNKEIISEWLKRAKSNLEIARAGKSSKEILLEKSLTPNVFRKYLPFCDFLGTALI